MAVLDVIKFGGLASRDWLVYKHPRESITMGSQLIVGEGQVAIFVKGGAICDVFTPGTYTLSTQNLPLLQGIINLPFGGKTPFSAEIYYINTVTRLDLTWGTSDPIQLIDHKYHVRLRIRAFGQVGMKIADYSSFLRELIGSMNASDIVRYTKVLDFYKGILVTKVKSIIADIIIHDQISALEIAAQLDDISRRVQELLTPEFGKFGMQLINFFVKSINFPDEDFETINKILEDKAAFEIMGDSRYATKRSFDVYEGAANNQNGVAGAFAAGGIGLGAGAAIAGGMQPGASVMQSPAPDAAYCPACHAANKAGAKFCNSCGASMTPPPPEPKQDVCPGCGSAVSAGSKFCPECGTSLAPPVCACGATLEPGSKFCSQCGRKVGE